MCKLRPLVNYEELCLWERQGRIVTLGPKPVTFSLQDCYTRFMSTLPIRSMTRNRQPINFQLVLVHREDLEAISHT